MTTTTEYDWLADVCPDGLSDVVPEDTIDAARRFADVLAGFDWPQRECGAEDFTLAEGVDGDVWIEYRQFVPDSDTPDDPTLSPLVYRVPFDPFAEPDELVLRVLLGSYEHELREQLRFGGEHTLYPHDEHADSPDDRRLAYRDGGNATDGRPKR